MSSKPPEPTKLQGAGRDPHKTLVKITIRIGSTLKHQCMQHPHGQYPQNTDT